MGAATRRGRRAGRRRLLRALYLLPLLALLSSGAVGAARYRADRADLAAWYARGEAAAATGRYVAAVEAFVAAGDYRDAAARRAAAVAALVPYRAAYLDGAAALDAGRHDEAIATLLPVARELPDYEDVTALLGRARAARTVDLRQRADTAVVAEDWLAAEHALAALAAESPDDEALAARLATLRREHAPLVVARDRALHVVGADGGDGRVLVDGVSVAWPVWSPDRTRIAFASVDHSEPSSITTLYVINADGTGLVRVDDWVTYHAPPVWSPDGTRLAYTTLEEWTGRGDDGRLSVRVARADGGEVVDVTAERFALALNPSWSPDGDRLAFVSKTAVRNQHLTSAPSDVQVLTLATGQIVDLTRGGLPGAWTPTWSPVDERILVYTFSAEGYYESSDAGVALVDAGTGALSILRSGAETVQPPVWSPDGEHFAYADGPTSIRIRGRGPGEAWINVAHEVHGALTWSPDGGTLLAVAEDPALDAFLIPVADGAPVPIPFPYDGSSPPGLPQWSPVNLAVPPAPPSVAGTALDGERGDWR